MILQQTTIAEIVPAEYATTQYKNWSGPADILYKTRVERLALQVNIVLLGVCLFHVDILQASQIVSFLLKALDDLTNQASLHPVGLYHDERLLQSHAGNIELPVYRLHSVLHAA